MKVYILLYSSSHSISKAEHEPSGASNDGLEFGLDCCVATSLLLWVTLIVQ